jgi:prepilin-type N-terminal cleavage/methylation domain-containing protein
MMSRTARGAHGFTLIELLIVVAIISLVSAMAIPVYENALENTHRSALQADSYQLYHSLMKYQFDNDKFPAESDFNLQTLAPLSTDGYFNAAPTFTSKLRDKQVLLYLAPDIDGEDTQFVLLAQSEIDPTMIFAVVYTNIVEETGGWVDGVYIITPEDLEDAGDDLGVGDKEEAVPPDTEPLIDPPLVS